MHLALAPVLIRLAMTHQAIATTYRGTAIRPTCRATTRVQVALGRRTVRPMEIQPRSKAIQTGTRGIRQSRLCRECRFNQEPIVVETPSPGRVRPMVATDK